MAEPEAEPDPLLEEAQLEGPPAVTEADWLYHVCRKAAAASPERERKSFSQEQLLALCQCESLAHIKEAATLMPLIQELSDAGLLVSLKDKNVNYWKLRTREIAAKLQPLPKDVRTVYAVVEEAHQSGAWLRTLKSKIGIKDEKSLKKMVATLIRCKLIKDVTNVKSVGKIYYMLAHLTPSDDLTGGSFFDKGALDESLISDLSDFIVFHVRQNSWIEQKKKRVKRETSPVLVRDDEVLDSEVLKNAARLKKRKRETNSTSHSKDIEDAGPPRKQQRQRHPHDIESETHVQLAFPAGHEYPTATSIYDFITENNILQGAKAESLAVEEVQNVLDVLVWDEKLEKVNGGYRSVRGFKPKPLHEDKKNPEDEKNVKRGNALTDIPCGQCPVHSICGTGGLISATNCAYFDSWLGFAPPVMSAAAAKAAEAAAEASAKASVATAPSSAPAPATATAGAS